MGWGTYARVYLNRIYKSEIPHKIPELEEYKTHLETRLVALAASGPHNFEDTPWDLYVSQTMRDLLEEYANTTYQLSVMYQAQEDPEHVVGDE